MVAIFLRKPARIDPHKHPPHDVAHTASRSWVCASRTSGVISTNLPLTTPALIADRGFTYDSSMMADDDSYALDLGQGRTLIEVPTLGASTTGPPSPTTPRLAT